MNVVIWFVYEQMVKLLSPNIVTHYLIEYKGSVAPRCRTRCWVIRMRLGRADVMVSPSIVDML